MSWEDIIKKSIILIGPMGTGKSTISKVLSEKTKMPRISLDSYRLYNRSFYENSSLNYREKFDFNFVHQVFSEISEPSVIDFGAGHSVYENQETFTDFKKMMECFSNVVLILPSSNMTESINILNERRQISIMSELDKENWRFLTFEGNEELATIVVYTNNKSPDSVADEIVELINSREKGIKI